MSLRRGRPRPKVAGLAEAPLVALAERLDTVDIATLDERHFASWRPLAAGQAFRLLAIDS